MADPATPRRRKGVILIAFMLTLLSSVSLAAGSLLDDGAAAERSEKIDEWSFEEPEFLPVDEAFVLSAEVARDGSVLARCWLAVPGFWLALPRW